MLANDPGKAQRMRAHRAIATSAAASVASSSASPWASETKAALVGGRRQIDPLLEHGVEEAPEATFVGLFRLIEVSHRSRVEEEAQHSADRGA